MFLVLESECGGGGDAAERVKLVSAVKHWHPKHQETALKDVLYLQASLV